jgi:hypothetical protein
LSAAAVMQISLAVTLLDPPAGTGKIARALAAGFSSDRVGKKIFGPRTCGVAADAIGGTANVTLSLS